MRSILCGAALGILAACASGPIYLSPVQDDGLDVIYVAGHEVAIAESDNGQVSVFGFSQGQEWTGDLWLHARYLNTSGDRVDVIPDAVTVLGDDGEQLKVWEPNALIRQQQTAQAIAIVAQAMSGAIQASRAGQSSSSGYGTVRYGGQTGYYNYQSSSYDATAAALVRAQNAEDIRRSTELYAAQHRALEQRLLQRTTLLPGAYIEGDIFVAYKQAGLYEIAVPFGGDVFVFRFRTVER